MLQPQSEIELLRQDFRIVLNEVYELRSILEAMEEESSEYLSVSKFAKLVGYSRETVRTWCNDQSIHAIQPHGPRGGWRIHRSEVKKVKQKMKRGEQGTRIFRKEI